MPWDTAELGMVSGLSSYCLRQNANLRPARDVFDTVSCLGSSYRIILGALKRHMRVETLMSPAEALLSPPLTSPTPSIRSGIAGSFMSMTSPTSGSGSMSSPSSPSRKVKEAVAAQDGRWVVVRAGRTSRKVWVPAGSDIKVGA